MNELKEVHKDHEDSYRLNTSPNKWCLNFIMEIICNVLCNLLMKDILHLEGVGLEYSGVKTKTLTYTRSNTTLSYDGPKRLQQAH